MTTTTTTLDMLESRLCEPFAVEEIKFLPKSPVQEHGSWKCLALPYADKRAYEDRLNDIAFGQWSTPPNPACLAGNKLVIPVTVVICGVARTDYGEAFLSSLSRKGESREEENSATEAYSQAFRRACAQFRLGRYLYRLRKLWLPYDPEKRQIALSDEEKIQRAIQLYREAGLLPNAPDEAHIELIDDRLLAWVRTQIQNDEAKVRRICHYYRVSRLEDLTASQAIHLTNYILHANANTTSTPAVQATAQS